MEGSTFSFIKARVWFKVRIRSLGFGKGQASFKAAVAKFDKAGKKEKNSEHFGAISPAVVSSHSGQGDSCRV